MASSNGGRSIAAENSGKIAQSRSASQETMREEQSSGLNPTVLVEPAQRVARDRPYLVPRERSKEAQTRERETVARRQVSIIRGMVARGILKNFEEETNGECWRNIGLSGLEVMQEREKRKDCQNINVNRSIHVHTIIIKSNYINIYYC
jgi:hypothetical protein